MRRKSLGVGLLCFVIWGLLPIYWQYLSGVDSLFVLANRVAFSAVFCLILLAAKGRIGLLVQAFRDRAVMKYLLPASILITCNWGIYIWAMTHGHMLDSSFGYYVEPLVVAMFGVVFFKERCSRLQILAFGFAFAGVAYYAISLGRLPMVSLGLCLTFAIYGALKKKVCIDPVVSIAGETIIVTPLALVYIIFCLSTGRADGAFTAVTTPLLILSGVVTAAPLILFSSGVNNLPLYIMGFLQYVSSTLQLMCGLIYGETLGLDQLICNILIWIGFIVFSISLILDHKSAQAVEA